MGPPNASTIHEGIAAKYRKVAVSPEGLFRYPTGEASARGLGYPPDLLPAIPPVVRARFVGVGNPFSLGPVRVGESVLDLGCGAGFDTFVAAQHVGLEGHVVGIDLSLQRCLQSPAPGKSRRDFPRSSSARPPSRPCRIRTPPLI